MKTLKLGVLGTGSLGKNHARIYSELAQAGMIEFAGIYDVLESSAKTVSNQLGGVHIFSSIEDLIDHCDAVSVVTPTTTHYELSRRLLEEGKHVLVEKPMCDHAAQAYDLVTVVLHFCS